MMKGEADNSFPFLAAETAGVIGRICFFLFEVASTLCAYPDR